MCGIAGAVNWSYPYERIIDTLAHRGPDDSNSYQYKNVDFFHLRLSVLDLVSGRQPMHMGEKYTIIFNGEIYNHKDLSTGAKLLWGEYNSLSKGRREYFAKRSYTSKRLYSSVESITNWTKELEGCQLLKEYRHRRGYCSSQKVIILNLKLTK